MASNTIYRAMNITTIILWTGGWCVYCTTMNNKCHSNSQNFLFHYLHSTFCITNWLTWSLNAARLSKNLIMTHQHAEARNHFPYKMNPHRSPNPWNSWNPNTCFAELNSSAESLLKSTNLNNILLFRFLAILTWSKILQCWVDSKLFCQQISAVDFL